MFGFHRAAAACVLTASVLGAGSLLFVSGCQHSENASADASKSLYDRLGGEPAITAVVDNLVAKAAADPAVNFTRKGHPNHWEATPENVAKLKKHLVQFIAQATGGPKNYEGRDMAAVHAGMEISEKEWDAFVADLKAALNDLKVPDKEQADLIAVVATTHDSIVGK